MFCTKRGDFYICIHHGYKNHRVYQNTKGKGKRYCPQNMCKLQSSYIWFIRRLE